MRRDPNLTVPADLRQAEELLEKYGAWAQDRYKKRRCASAEGRYTPPPVPDAEREEPLAPFIPDWSAMNVHRALNEVPAPYRRVLHAFYIPQRLPQHAIRRQLKIPTTTWIKTRIEGLRMFWNVYRLHHLTR
ncbi:hypothetical protein [Comamonas sp. GB3 AK4-5]|uniref:hypothetical protein n=1 Tax=Comamonas sp. GB3 AK4-5 TaxID=3231487 RepID=UPI00351F1B49